MATERQIQANRANAAKSTGPITPEGKRASSQNAARHRLVSSTVVLKGESTRRFNDLESALLLQFRPRNCAEAALVQTMIAARWRLLRMWGIQTAVFELEMARAHNSDPSAGSGAILAAATFRNLADNSRVLALQLRLEAAYDRQYHRALALLLKLRLVKPSLVKRSDAPVDPPPQLATETWDDDSQGEPNFDADLETDPACNEQVPNITPAAPPLIADPIPPSQRTLGGRARTRFGTCASRRGACPSRRDGNSRPRQRKDSARSPPAEDAPSDVHEGRVPFQHPREYTVTALTCNNHVRFNA